MDTLACIYFVTKDFKANTIGYLELPDYVSTISQHEIYVDEEFEMQVRYYDDIKPLSKYVSNDDYAKVVRVFMLNDWQQENYFAVVDLKNWERVLI
ncbi:hypothetical protein [Staphylococcus saprophyticus]|uniref:hypothetical protein n=1 Tax=Staphylococcus saprophyticus TaxID=29385 RepID=UPI0034C66569